MLKQIFSVFHSSHNFFLSSFICLTLSCSLSSLISLLLYYYYFFFVIRCLNRSSVFRFCSCHVWTARMKCSKIYRNQACGREKEREKEIEIERERATAARLQQERTKTNGMMKSSKNMNIRANLNLNHIFSVCYASKRKVKKYI